MKRETADSFLLSLIFFSQVFTSDTKWFTKCINILQEIEGRVVQEERFIEDENMEEVCVLLKYKTCLI